MTGTQLSFTLRTSTNVKTVHLLGSWDNYSGQLPLSRDGKAGAWKGAFRFQATTLAPGQRYWYYYIMDGYHVSHDPAKPSTVEPTTKRKLNILDVPKSRAAETAEVPQGRGVSPSRIVHPKPSKPYASRGLREADYSRSPVDELTGQLEQASLYGAYSASPPSSVGSSLSSRSSGGSSPASLSSLSDSSGGSRCSCKRYGITRSGSKVLIDCGGRRCGYSDDSSSGCSSEDDSGSEIDSSDSEEEEVRKPVRKPASKATPATKSRTQTAAPRRAAQATRRR